jgi:hypothetical protein
MNTNKYNSEFDKIKSLSWYPWIGTSYENNTDSKFLIIGESHYVINQDDKFNQEKFDKVIKNKRTTQLVVEEAIECNGRYKFFINASKALMGDASYEFSKLWSKVAFYNFIQIPMVTQKGRPKTEDFLKGWETYFEIIKVIKPTHCIFLGSSSAGTFKKFVSKQMNIEYEDVNYHMKFGRYWGKKGSITIDGFKTNITFIKHPSSFFTWQDWYSYLTKRKGQSIINLRENVMK